MSEAALIRELESFLSGNYNPVAAIVLGEQTRGFHVVRPGDASWFRASDWKATSVASIKGTIIRLVLLDAFQNGRGAFTRTVAAIEEIGGKPSVIDPTPQFAATLKRRGWHGRLMGRSFETRETVWRPKRNPK